MSELKDLKGQRFGKLLVIERAENLGHHSRWKCLCDCGNITTSHTTSLTSGRSKSCGCLGIENAAIAKIKHGEANRTHLYKVWLNIRRRCNGKNNDNYSYYGGKGIRVCNEWKEYVNFRNWALLNGYKEHLEIDRIDNSKDYEPSNCKWSTRTEQVRNRSNSIRLENGGTEKSLIEWCKNFGVDYKLAYARYKKGLDFDSIFKQTYAVGVTWLDKRKE